MQQQIQRFLEEYFKKPKSSNKETIKSNKPSAANRNGTTTLKEKDILQEEDKTENLNHHEGITKPVMSISAQEIQASTTELMNKQMKPLNSSYPGIPTTSSKSISLGRSKLQLTLFLENGKSNAALIEIETKNLRRSEELIAAWVIHFEEGKMIREHQDAVRKAIYHTKLEWATDLNESGRTMYSRKEHIKKSVKIPSATYRSDKENTQPVGMQSVKGENILNKQQTDNLQSDNKRFNIKENTSNHTGHTEPNEKSMMDLLCNIMNRLEIIESNQKRA
ncbi:32091_t:CDS:2, partial [Gigaspora margarita]